MTKLIRRVFDWIQSQSDLAHTSMAIGGVSACVPLLPSLSPPTLLGLCITSTGVQLGTQAYVGFVSGPTMFLNMPRQEFGNIQSRLFPKMGQVCVGTGVVSLASAILMTPGQPIWDTLSAPLWVSLACNALNALLVFPATTRLMFKLREHQEGTEARKKLGAKFGIAHGISVLINFVSMGANVAFICLLASKLAPGL